MEHYENVLKFLDCAIRTTNEKSESVQKLDDKLDYQTQVSKLHAARTVLRVNYYAYMDYLKNGTYELPIKK